VNSGAVGALDTLTAEGSVAVNVPVTGRGVLAVTDTLPVTGTGLALVLVTVTGVGGNGGLLPACTENGIAISGSNSATEANLNICIFCCTEILLGVEYIYLDKHLIE
jgi:hypothetical protein